MLALSFILHGSIYGGVSETVALRKKVTKYPVSVITVRWPLAQKQQIGKQKVDIVPIVENILQLCKGRVVLFENKSKDKIKQAKQVRELLSHVDSVVAANNGKPFSDNFIVELKEGALRTLDQVKNVESLKEFTGYTEEHITDLKNEIYKSYNDQLARITEMVEQRLQQSVERLERQLADEQAAREAAVNSAQEAHKRSAEEIRELRKSLEKAKEESEDFRRRAAEHKCAIL